MKANIDLARIREIRIPIATELILSFSLIIAISSVVFIKVLQECVALVSASAVLSQIQNKEASTTKSR